MKIIRRRRTMRRNRMIRSKRPRRMRHLRVTCAVKVTGVPRGMFRHLVLFFSVLLLQSEVYVTDTEEEELSSTSILVVIFSYISLT